MQTLQQYKTAISAALNKMAAQANTSTALELYNSLFQHLYKWKSVVIPTTGHINVVNKQKKIAVHVTNNNSPQYIKKILQTHLKKRSYIQYPTLYFLMPKGKGMYPFMRFDKETKNRFAFDKDTHIIDNHFFIKKLSKLDLPILETLHEQFVTAGFITKKQVEKKTLPSITNNVSPSLPIPSNNKAIKAIVNAAQLQIQHSYPPQLALSSPPPPYYKRPVDQQLLQALQQKQHMLLIGKALVGKTRAALKAIQQTSARVITLNPQYFDKNFALPVPSANTPTIIWLDALDTYYQYHDQNPQLVDYVLELCINSGAQLVATLQTGTSYYVLQALMQPNIWAAFTQYTIPTLSTTDVENFQDTVNQRLDFTAFEQTQAIGELCGNITQLHKRYIQFSTPSNNKRQRKINQLAQSILLAVKCLYTAHNVTQASHIVALQKVKEFCQRYIGRIIKSSTWNEAINLLANNEKGLNFIRLNKAGNTIISHVSYITRAIAPNYNTAQIHRLLHEHYTTVQEQQENGYFQKTYAYNNELEQINNYNDAQALVDTMQRANVKANIATYNLLISKAPHYQIAQQLLNHCCSLSHITPNVNTFIPVFKRAHTPQQLQVLYTQMQQQQIQANAYIYLLLINKAGSYQEARKYAQQMQTDNMFSIAAFNKLLHQAPTFDVAHGEFLQHTTYKLTPNLQTYNILLQKQVTFAQATQIIAQMRKQGIIPTALIYQHYAASTHNKAQIAQVFAQLQNDGIAPTPSIFKELLDKTDNSTQLLSILQQMHNQNISIAPALLVQLLQKTKQYTLALHLLQSIQQIGIPINALAYNVVLEKSPSFGDSSKIFRQMRLSGITPNINSYNILIQQCDDFEQAKVLLQQAQLAKLAANSNTYILLINKAPNFKDAIVLFKKMQAQGIEPNKQNLHALQRKVRKQEQGFVNHMLKQHPQTFTDPTFTPIYVRCLYNIDVDKFLERANSYITKSDEQIVAYVTWLLKNQQLSQAATLLEQMQHKGDEYNRLLYKLIS